MQAAIRLKPAVEDACWHHPPHKPHNLTVQVIHRAPLIVRKICDGKWCYWRATWHGSAHEMFHECHVAGAASLLDPRQCQEYPRRSAKQIELSPSLRWKKVLCYFEAVDDKGISEKKEKLLLFWNCAFARRWCALLRHYLTLLSVIHSDTLVFLKIEK